MIFITRDIYINGFFVLLNDYLFSPVFNSLISTGTTGNAYINIYCSLTKNLAS